MLFAQWQNRKVTEVDANEAPVERTNETCEIDVSVKLIWRVDLGVLGERRNGSRIANTRKKRAQRI